MTGRFLLNGELTIDELLLTIAEIAVAFTGFAGVVSVFGRSRLDPRVQVWRIRSMIAAGLLTTFGALTPLAISQFELPLTASWRVSAAMLGFAVFLQFAFAAHGFRPLVKRNLIAPKRFEWFLAGVSASACVALGLLSLGFFGESIQAIYSLGLLYLLALSAHHFFLLVLAAQPRK